MGVVMEGFTFLGEDFLSLGLGGIWRVHCKMLVLREFHLVFIQFTKSQT